MNPASKLSHQKSHLRYITLLVLQKYSIKCYFCGRGFSEADLPARGIDLLTEHHIDGDHSNMAISNRTLVHRKCHKAYHASHREAKPAVRTLEPIELPLVSSSDSYGVCYVDTSPNI